ncbi:MAG: efflux RND transporter periplasmic adaptor subunit [Nitratireductor sp.]
MKCKDKLNTRQLLLGGLALLAAFGSPHVQAQDQLQNQVQNKTDLDLNGLNLDQTSTYTTPLAFEVRGLVKSSAKIEIMTDILAPVAQAPYLEGMNFSKGDLLIGFDCKRYEAELKAAKAAASAAWLDHKSKKRLLRHGAVGRDEVGLAGAKAVEASAQMEVQKARNISCDFIAPFAGRVVELNTRQHEFPKNNQPLMVIIDDSDLEIEMVVPSNWLTWMKPKLPFDFLIDETGARVNGYVSRIGAEVDPVSQTIKLVGKIDKQQDTVLSGMSGTALFKGKAK